MNRNSIVLILSILAVVVAATAGGYASGKRVTERAYTSARLQATAGRPDRQTTGRRHTMTITYNVYGFMPNIATVAAGTVVQLVNSSGSPVFFRAAPCLAATPELNVGILAVSGQQKTFVASHRGTWRYENAYAPRYQGSLTVR